MFSLLHKKCNSVWVTLSRWSLILPVLVGRSCLSLSDRLHAVGKAWLPTPPLYGTTSHRQHSQGYPQLNSALVAKHVADTCTPHPLTRCSRYYLLRSLVSSKFLRIRVPYYTRLTSRFISFRGMSLKMCTEIMRIGDPTGIIKGSN